jgi:hypothetical protein
VKPMPFRQDIICLHLFGTNPQDFMQL